MSSHSPVRITPILAAFALFSVSAFAQSTIDVHSFGAKGDGTTDDTAAISKASQAAAAKPGSTLGFPEGTYIFNPAVSKIVVGTTMTIAGPGTIKVKPNAGDYKYIIGAENPAAALDTITLSNLHVDQNVEQNQTSNVVVANPNTDQFIFLSFHVHKLTVENCKFDASGVNTIDANGRVDEANFINNSVVFHYRAGQKTFDNSAFYFSGTKGTATGNRCAGAPTGYAMTCIEMHTGDVVIKDNVIDGYTIGINLADNTSALVTGNTITHTLNGVFIWSNHGKICKDVTITDNKIQVNQVQRNAPESDGISTYYGKAQDGTIDHLTIRNNDILFQRETQPRSIKYPNVNWGISTQAFGSVRNVTIENNRIVNAPVRAIKIGEPGIEARQSNIVVRNNTIIDAGFNTDSSVAKLRAAIAVDGKLDNVQIQDNKIQQSAAPAGTYSVFVGKHDEPYQGVKIPKQQVESQQELQHSVTPDVKR